MSKQKQCYKQISTKFINKEHEESWSYLKINIERRCDMIANKTTL